MPDPKRLVVIVGLVIVAGVAAAKPKDTKPGDENADLAKSYFKAGRDLFESGEFLEAAKQFERAYNKVPAEKAFLYNVANSYDKGGDRKNAVAWYQKYIEAVPDPKKVAQAKARVTVLEREMKELDAARGSSNGAAPTEKPARATPPALPFVEPVTKHTYQTWIPVDGKPYTMIGVGARKYMGFKVYGMALYVEDDAARAAFPKLAATAGGADHDTLVHSEQAFRFVVLGEFGKAAQLYFVRNVSAKDTRDSYRDSLPSTFAATASAQLKADGEAFLNLFEDMKDGELLVLRTTAEGQVVVEVHGKKKVGPNNARLTHDIWDIWLGLKPITTDLKKGLIDRIDTLGR